MMAYPVWHRTLYPYGSSGRKRVKTHIYILSMQKLLQEMVVLKMSVFLISDKRK